MQNVDHLEEEEDDDEYMFTDDDQPEELPASSSLTIQDILGSLFEMQGSVPNPRLGGVGTRDIIRLLRAQSGLRMHLGGDDDDEDDEEDDDDAETWSTPFTEPQQKQESGMQLLRSGNFGSLRTQLRARRNDRNIARRILGRTSATRPNMVSKEEIAQNLVPNSHGATVACNEANIYSAQYSADSSFFYTCSQDFKLHIYDTTAAPRDPPRNAPAAPSLSTTMRVAKSINGAFGQWTITDSHLSPNNDRLIYSSLTPTVHLTSTRDDSTRQIPISLADPPTARRRHQLWDESSDHTRIYSCRFSADGNEIIAGGNGSIYVYDLLASQRTVKIAAHAEDINSCAWADTQSGNVLVSASDDTHIKIWDRRSLGSSPKPSGVLVGHTEGITHVSAKGDGRYIISNGKEQTLRLWDLRAMHSSTDFDGMSTKSYGQHGFDYRNSTYRQPRYRAHPRDCSVMSYRGHSVMRTLIRCHFSPMETTGAQYIYSGSADGKIHIWSLDGTVVQVLDRSKTLPMSFDPSGPEPPESRSKTTYTCVRDVSWNPQQPVMISAAWERESGYYRRSGGSTLARHEWKGLSKMPGALEDWVEKHRQEENDSSSSHRQHIPGAFHGDDED